MNLQITSRDRGDARDSGARYPLRSPQGRRNVSPLLLYPLLGLLLAACAQAIGPADRTGAPPTPHLAARATSIPMPVMLTPPHLAPGESLHAATVTPVGPASLSNRAVAATPTVSAFATATSAPADFALGVPAGDAYAPMSLAVDAARGRAYVYHADSAESHPVISVVDLAKGQASRVFRLGGTQPAGYGRILLSPEGAQAYVFDFDAETLTWLDPETGMLGRPIPELRDGVLSSDGKTLYALGPWGLRAYNVALLLAGEERPLWGVSRPGFDRVALNGDRVLVSVQVPRPQLLVYDAATGDQLVGTTLNGYPNGVAAGPNGGWVARVSGDVPQVLRFDRDLEPVASAAAPYGTEIYYDAVRGRYLVSGLMPGTEGKTTIQALRDDDLSQVAASAWPSWDVPEVFAAHDDLLLGLNRAGPARVFIMGPELDVRGRVITGVALADMALDETADTLYVADDQDQVHVLGLPGGEERALWHGSAPIALDVANRRLYVDGADGVQALSLDSGEPVATYPQSGISAPDSRSRNVYITDRGVTIYDRSGRKLGELPGTFPQEHGFSPDPYAEAARVNPVNGAVAVIFNNGVPGSNNGSYLRIYLPGVEQPLDVPGFFSFVSDLTFDAIHGHLYVGYSPAKNLGALQRLGPDGQELARLGGRTGRLALDASKGLLYVVQGGAIARVASDTLTLLDVWHGPERADQVALHSRLGQLYVQNSARSRLSVIPVNALQPFDMRPQMAAMLPSDASFESLAVVDDRKGGQWVFAGAAGSAYRSRDGERWERLAVGSLPIWGRLTVAGDGALFYAGQGSAGSDGVWRSTDFGEGWELLSAGLTDLRTDQSVRAEGADQAYFVGRTAGLFAWQPGTDGTPGRWEGRLAPQEEWQGVGQLSLARPATLFLDGFDLLRRSTDGGRSWADLHPPDRAGSILGFSGNYTETPTVFGLYGETERSLFRSTDAGRTWVPVDTPLNLDPLAASLTLLADDGTVYLHGQGDGDLASVLLRSTDNGDNWQIADEPAIAGTQKMAIGTDGRLWLGRPGMVTPLDPEAIRWVSAG